MFVDCGGGDDDDAKGDLRDLHCQFEKIKQAAIIHSSAKRK
jgi:hypothetical protein